MKEKLMAICPVCNSSDIVAILDYSYITDGGNIKPSRMGSYCNHCGVRFKFNKAEGPDKKRWWCELSECSRFISPEKIDCLGCSHDRS